jgi:hypothetical protein
MFCSVTVPFNERICGVLGLPANLIQNQAERAVQFYAWPKKSNQTPRITFHSYILITSSRVYLSTPVPLVQSPPRPQPRERTTKPLLSNILSTVGRRDS